MKRLGISALLVLSAFICNAQLINLTGTVTNKSGNPLHYAFLQDKQSKTATYTDGSGNFALSVNPNAQIRVSCAGFGDTLINVGNKTSLQLALRGSVISAISPSGVPNNQATNINQATLRDQINLSNNPNVNATGTPVAAVTIVKKTGEALYNEPALGTNHTDLVQGAIFPVFSTKEETRGSRYLFTDWAHGYVVSKNDSIIQRPGFLFNYDKIDGGLLLSQDAKSAIEVNRDLIKSFTLFGPENQQYKFEYIPSIDKGHYVQVLDEGDKYKIYKKIAVEFVKSDYATNGLTTTGNRYDEYLDKGTYFIITNNGAPQQIYLKKKSLKEAFSADADKLNKYFKENSGDIDDNYLIDVGVYMNR